MKYIFKILNKISEILQVTTIWLAFLYGVIWFYRFFNLPYNLLNPIIDKIEFVNKIVGGYVNWSVNFMTWQVDMTYIASIIVLIPIYFVFYNITAFFEKLVNECLIEEIERKKKEERLLNEELEENLKNETLENNSFLCLLDLHLEYAINEGVTSNPVDLITLKNSNNRKIIANIKTPYTLDGRIKNGKITYAVENFDTFDNFIDILLDSVKMIYRENKNLNVNTSFTLSCDAIKSISNTIESFNILDKISTFKYFNKIVVTTLFLSRYNYTPSHKYKAKTMGISRFFKKKSINLNGEVQFESEDFDLYSLYIKKTY